MRAPKIDTAPADQLEPAVRAMAAQLFVHAEQGGKVDAVSAIAPAIFSAAISLKRIADRLESATPEVAGGGHFVDARDGGAL